MGRVAAGKTTLMQRLKGEQISYCKTQYVYYTDTIIDTPGEYTENGKAYQMKFSPQPEDISYLRTFKFEDLTYRGTIEFRSSCCQPIGDVMTVAKKIAADAALHGILLDAIAYFGLAELYPQATRTINDIKTVYLEPETGIFKIIMEIKKCL
jgi:gamma-glutamylcysteine synthetase